MSRRKKLAFLIYQERELRKCISRWKRLYGRFDGEESYRVYSLRGLDNETASYYGELVKWIKDIVSSSSKKILLAGESKGVAGQIKARLRVRDVCTCGLLDADYEWNFEEDPPPEMGKFDIIVSQAMLEHLLNPYKHVCDLVKLLAPSGYLMIHTALPGFHYHRYPIDTLRFYPDWFEEVAKRLRLIVVEKRIRHFDLFYLYRTRID